MTQAEAKSCVAAIRKLCARWPEVVAIDVPDWRHNNVCNVNFNGLGDDAHETFTFYTRYLDEDEVPQAVAEALGADPPRAWTKHILTPEGVLEFNCCKTARKPYDRLVKQALLDIQRITGGKLVLSDDGENAETDPPGWRALLGELR